MSEKIFSKRANFFFYARLLNAFFSTFDGYEV